MFLVLLLTALFTTTTTAKNFDKTYGYKAVSGADNLYKVHKDEANWKDAWRICSDEDAHLLVLETSEEAEAIGNLLKGFKNSEDSDGEILVSVGVHSLFSDRFWTTIFGEPLDQFYSPWAAGRPDEIYDHINQCGMINMQMELVDYPCGSYTNTSFICERSVE